MKKFLAELEDNFCGVILLVMTILTCINVFARYVFRSSMPFVEELTSLGLVIISLTGAAVAAKRGAHLGLTLLTDFLPEKAQKACVILITVVDEQGGSLLPCEKDVLMEQLGADIGRALRIGDVYTRYTSSQYLLLVIDTTEGQADRIVGRIKEQFLVGRQGNNILIHHCYELQPARIRERLG